MYGAQERAHLSWLTLLKTFWLRYVDLLLLFHLSKSSFDVNLVELEVHVLQWQATRER